MSYIIGKSSINRNKLGIYTDCKICRKTIETKKAKLMKLNKDHSFVSYVCEFCYFKNSDRIITIWKYDFKFKHIEGFFYSRKYAIVKTIYYNFEVPKECIQSVKGLKLFPKSYFIYTNQKKLKELLKDQKQKLGEILNG